MPLNRFRPPTLIIEDEDTSKQRKSINNGTYSPTSPPAPTPDELYNDINKKFNKLGLKLYYPKSPISQKQNSSAVQLLNQLEFALRFTKDTDERAKIFKQIREINNNTAKGITFPIRKSKRTRAKRSRAKRTRAKRSRAKRTRAKRTRAKRTRSHNKGRIPRSSNKRY